MMKDARMEMQGVLRPNVLSIAEQVAREKGVPIDSSEPRCAHASAGRRRSS